MFHSFNDSMDVEDNDASPPSSEVNVIRPSVCEASGLIDPARICQESSAPVKEEVAEMDWVDEDGSTSRRQVKRCPVCL